MNQSGTSDNLLGSEEGAPPEVRLPDSDPGGAAPPERAAAGSRWGVVGPAAEEEITGDPSRQEDLVPDPGVEQKELDDQRAEVRARVRRRWQMQWQKQRTASILSSLTMDCMRTAKSPTDSDDQEQLESRWRNFHPDALS